MDPLDKYLKQPVKPQQQGFNPASLLPAIGGTIGAIGGGIIGGPAGAGIGGALGGGAGSALEQAIGGKGVDIGKVGQEAALSGVLGYGPLRALGLVTGTRGLGTAIANRAFGEVAGQGVAAAGKAAPRYSEALANAWGINKNVKLAGARLGEAKAAQLQQFVADIAQPVKFKSATNVQSALESFANTTGKSISNSLKTPKVVEVNTLKTELNNAFKKVPGVGITKTGVSNTTAKDISKQIVATGGNTAKIWATKKLLQKQINQNLTEGNAESVNQMVLHKAVDVLNNSLKTAHEDLGQLFSNYHNAQKAIEAMAKPALRPGGVPLPGTLGRNVPITGKAWQAAQAEAALAGRKVVPEAVQAGGRQVAPAQMTRLEQALRYGGRGRAPIAEGGGFGQKLQNIQTFTALPLSQKVALIRASAPSAIKRQTLAAFMGGVDMGTASPSVTSEQDLIGTTQPVAPAEAVNPYPVENMLYDVSRDPKNANKYISIFNTVQTYMKNQTKSQNLTEAQQARQDIIGMTADAQKLLASGDIKIGFGGLLGKIEKFKGQFNLGDNRTLYFYNLLGNLIGTIARARGGTSFTATERAMMNQYAPTINDSEQQIAQKLQAISDYYTKNPNGGGATGSTVYSPADIQNQVMQGLGG